MRNAFWRGFGILGRVKDEVLLRIGFLVAKIAFVVVICLLAHGDRQDEGQGSNIRDDEAFAW